MPRSSGVHELSRADARRLAVRAQLLTADRPTDVLETVRGLTFLQLNPVSAVAPSADLVLWSRLGWTYDPPDLQRLLDERVLVEYQGMVRPAEQMSLYGAQMAAWPGDGDLKPWEDGRLRWVEANDQCRREVIERLDADGPLPTSRLPDTCAVPWRSSGWTNDRNLGRLLDFMVARGEVAVAGRENGERLWDLAERVYPDEPFVPEPEATTARGRLRLRALGIARARSAVAPGEPNDVGEVGAAAVVDGVRGRWQVEPELLDQPFAGRTALLSPLDRLAFDRKRLMELFEFDYQLEMYKPAAQRKWGYFALPILHGDRLIGKADVTADHQAGLLRVTAVHEDEPFVRSVRGAVDAELDDLARWLGLRVRRSR